MKKIMMITLGVLLIMPALVGAEVITGEMAPDFTLTDAEGKEHTLSDYRGKYVVLEWFNHECPFVRKHYDSGNMQMLQERYTDRGVVWFSVISSAPGKQGYCTPSEAMKLKEEDEANPTAILLDPEGKVGRRYAAKTTPHMYVIDPEGTLIYQGAIDSIPSADPADIADARNYVVAALEASMAGEDVPVPSTKSYGCSVKY